MHIICVCIHNRHANSKALTYLNPTKYDNEQTIIMQAQGKNECTPGRMAGSNDLLFEESAGPLKVCVCYDAFI